MTLDQVVEDIVNDRILPQSAMLNENMNGDGNGNDENNMYYNTSMSARLCMQTPFGEGRVERETVYEGNKFVFLKLSWERAYINEKEVRNTRISLSPPPEIYQNFNNNNSSSNKVLHAQIDHCHRRHYLLRLVMSVTTIRDYRHHD